MRMSKTDASGLGDIIWSLSVPKGTPGGKWAGVDTFDLYTGVDDAPCDDAAPEAPFWTGDEYGGVMSGDRRSLLGGLVTVVGLVTMPGGPGLQGARIEGERDAAAAGEQAAAARCVSSETGPHPPGGDEEGKEGVVRLPRPAKGPVPLTPGEGGS
jgi:hypothetical protein